MVLYHMNAPFNANYTWKKKVLHYFYYFYVLYYNLRVCV